MTDILNPNLPPEINLQNLVCVLEGYRSFFLQYDLVAEYHCGSTKYHWFQIGWDMAEKDWAATK